MKIVNKFKMLTGMAILLLLSSCVKEEQLNPVSVVEQSKSDKKIDKFDEFLKREFRDPYNIEVIYKLDDVETDLNYNVTPVTREKAIQITNLIKYLCLDAYKNHSPKDFLKENFPKKIVLVGSGAYNIDGIPLLGTAQGGVKIVLYAINDMNPLDTAGLVDNYFITIFHEFSHILHQKKMYTKDFQKITPNYVGDSWSKYWGDKDTGTPKSCLKGFISDYSSKEKSEDFVEIIAHQITLSDEQWVSKIDPKGDNVEGSELMNKKVSVVKNYLKDSWNINLDDMNTEVQDRLNNLDALDINNID